MVTTPTGTTGTPHDRAVVRVLESLAIDGSARRGESFPVAVLLPLVELAGASEILGVHRRVAGIDDPRLLCDSVEAVRDAARAVAVALLAAAPSVPESIVAATGSLVSAWVDDPLSGVQRAPQVIARGLAGPARGVGGVVDALAQALAVLVTVGPVSSEVQSETGAPALPGDQAHDT